MAPNEAPVLEVVAPPPGAPGAAPAPGGTLGVPPPPAPVTAPAPDPAPAAPIPSPAPPPAAPRETPPTAAAGAPKPGEEAPPPPVAGKFPDDWRDVLAGDNKAARKMLDRYQSPQDWFKSDMALRQKMSAGELKKALPTNATAEEIADYRKDNDIPEAPDGYDVKVDGMVWGDYDKPHVESWTQFAHENNMTPREVKLGLQWYARQQEMLVDALDAQDKINSARGSDDLRAEWGGKFKSNLNLAENLFGDSPKVPSADPKGQPVDMYTAITSARLADGRRLGDVPEVLKTFVDMSRGLMGEGTYIPPDGSTAKSPEMRLGELNTMMADKQSPYYRGPQSAILQEEWRNVWQLVEDNKARGAKNKAA